MWGNFLYHLAAGVSLGAIYSLIALGYTMVYGIIKLINFAHGEFCMVGAYAGLGVYLLVGEALPAWLAIPIVFLAAGVAGGLIGGVTERVAYRPIRRAGRFSALLTAIGVSFLLQNLANFVENGNPQNYAGWLGTLVRQSLDVGSGGIRKIELYCIPAAILLAVALWFIVHKTRFGRAMRAVSLDLAAAKLMGIRTDRVISRTFIMGGFLGGLAGALVGVTAVVEPMMGFMPGLNAFVAAVVGGIGSIGGALLGGFALGIIQYLVVWAGVPTGYKDVASFVMLILILVIRPQGILGKAEGQKV
jgi:branched-chain amino acid transport system permease protein